MLSESPARAVIDSPTQLKMIPHLVHDLILVKSDTCMSDTDSFVAGGVNALQDAICFLARIITPAFNSIVWLSRCICLPLFYHIISDRSSIG